MFMAIPDSTIVNVGGVPGTGRIKVQGQHPAGSRARIVDRHRGRLARRVIRERRPRAVVAVACERDMVSGLHDVAGKIPVLGLTMTLPSGPCKDAMLNMRQLEDWVRAYVA